MYQAYSKKLPVYFTIDQMLYPFISNTKYIIQYFLEESYALKLELILTKMTRYAREELLEVLERTIPEVKFNTFFAEDHDSALKVISENSVDITFLDIQMPGKNICF